MKGGPTADGARGVAAGSRGSRSDRALVSVVVPTHDRPRRLRRAVRSVAAQTYEPIELIVVDDASSPPVSDEIRDVAGPVERVRLRRFEDNRGGGAARNAGIEAASGPYVAFCDDDDRWDPAKLERQIPLLDAAPASVGLVYSGVVQLDGNGAVNAVSRAGTEGDLTRRLLTLNVVGTISSVVVRRDAAESVGGLDESLPSWQDWAFYIRLSERYRVRAVDAPLVVRDNAAADQLSGDYETKRDETAPRFRRAFGPLAAGFGPAFERRFEAFVEYHLGLAAIRSGKYRAARRHFLEAIGRYPRAPLFILAFVTVSGGRLTYEPLERLAAVLPLRSVKRRLQ